MGHIAHQIRFMPMALILLLWTLPAAAIDTLTLAVANSTCGAIEKSIQRYRVRDGIDIRYICKSSGLLAKGLRGGAIVADLYISANRPWMDYMIDAGLVAPESVVSPWGNALVVAMPKQSSLEIDDWQGLTSDAVHTILIGDPGTAPFGRYAKQALQNTGLWTQVRSKIETRKHITLLAETLAVADDSTLGILFSSNVTDDLRTSYMVDGSWHTPIRYYLAPVGDAAKRSEVAAFMTFLQEPEVREIFLAAGFQLTSPDE